VWSGFVVDEYGTGGVRSLEELKGRFENCMLGLSVMRRSEWIAVRIRDKDRSRGTDLTRSELEELENDRRNLASFEFGGDQTHGLVAGRSDRDQQRQIDLVVDEDLRSLGSGVADEPSRRCDRPHAGEVARRH
jgi:hypothetical protein